MQTIYHRRPARFVLSVYSVCAAGRVVEYLLIRTDQTVWGEAFLHKLAGILVLGVALKHLASNWSAVGFVRRQAGKQVLLGLLLGSLAFTVAYGAEFLFQLVRGNRPSLQLYVSTPGTSGNQTALLFFALCVAGNLINVVMEEGVFRGLFISLIQSRYSARTAAIISSCLFGLWHLAAPLRALLEGKMTLVEASLYGSGYVLLSALVGLKLCLLVQATGTLWVALADHFFNNTVINMLHLVTASGADELQILRVVVAQVFSGLLVLWLLPKTSRLSPHCGRVNPTIGKGS